MEFVVWVSWGWEAQRGGRLDRYMETSRASVVAHDDMVLDVARGHVLHTAAECEMCAAHVCRCGGVWGWGGVGW